MSPPVKQGVMYIVVHLVKGSSTGELLVSIIVKRIARRANTATLSELLLRGGMSY